MTKKNNPSKFCLDISGLDKGQKKKFAEMLSDSVDSFNDSIEGEN